jgi:formylglycine-generating enzyme required for sulfatase activity
LSAALRELRRLDSGELLMLAETPGEPLVRRLASGILLGAIGDPRIRVFDPPMVDIPAGRATIGLDPSQLDAVHAHYAPLGLKREWFEKECPRFTVELRGFRIGKYPVTNLEFLTFIQETGWSERPSSWSFGRFGFVAGNQPVHSVPPEAADAYATWLATRTGRRFRLPTEFEWEYAAAGPEARSFPWGKEFLEDHANTGESRLSSTTPIGIFPKGRSIFGAFDMAGNVEEYVADSYRPYPGGSLVEDDFFKAMGYYRITRGGAFNRLNDLARCHRRHGIDPKSDHAVGFRLAEELPG